MLSDSQYIVMYDRILVPTDGSAGMDDVITHAGTLARAHDCDVHALYVVDTGRFSTLPAETTWESVTTMLEREGETALDSFERLIGDGVTVEGSVVEGGPSQEIVEYASENGCDLIVMGTHGRGGINRLLLGSVAERVVRSSNVPVVTVPVTATERESPDGERPAGVPR